MFKFSSIKAVYTRLQKHEAGAGNSDGPRDDKEALLTTHTHAVVSQRKRRWICTPTAHIAIVSTELILFTILIAIYAFLRSGQHTSPMGDNALDGLTRLASTYNTTMIFYNQSSLLRSSHDADMYWANLLESGGVVSLNTKWALESGLRKSATSPTDPSQSIYQVDVFHALHCMVCVFISSWQTRSLTTMPECDPSDAYVSDSSTI